MLPANGTPGIMRHLNARASIKQEMNLHQMKKFFLIYKLIQNKSHFRVINTFPISLSLLAEELATLVASVASAQLSLPNA